MIGAAVLAVACQGQTRRPSTTSGSSNLVALPDSSAVYHVAGKLFGLSPTGVPTWQASLPDQATVIARLAVAPNSSVYVRSDRGLHAINTGGKLLWSVALPEPPSWMSVEMLAPVALSNSTVVLLETPQQLRAFNVDGTELWNATLPSGELRGPLAACPNGQVLVMTTSGVFAFSSLGEVAWSYAPPPPP